MQEALALAAGYHGAAAMGHGWKDSVQSLFVALCRGDSIAVTISQPAVQDGSTGEFRTVITDQMSLTITAAGAPFVVADTGAIEVGPLQLEARDFSLRAARAAIVRRRDELLITPRP